jgi:peptidoglycan/LPS O-acetylase OafA/YrhL
VPAENPHESSSEVNRNAVSSADSLISPADSQAQPRIPELDGLRGLAIFLVLLCHYVYAWPYGTPHSWSSRIATLTEEGQTGVDLFFVLSGFLIGGILLNSRSSPRYYKTFYVRRFYRIIPLFYGWVVLFWLASPNAPLHFENHIGEFRAGSIPYWVYFIFIQNFVLGYTPAQAIWLGSTWSLAVEEQFYLISPFLIRNLSKASLVKLLVGVVAFAAVVRLVLSTCFGASQYNWGIHASYLWTPSRADDLALGVLAAVAWADPGIRQWLHENRSKIYVLAFGCAACILVLLPWLVKPNSYVQATVGRPVYGFFYTSLLLIALVDKRSKLAGILRWRALRELGRVSYCVYIIHWAVDWMVFKFAWHTTPRFDSVSAMGLTIVALASTLAIAELSWHYFEYPLIRRGHRYSY